MMPYDHTDHEDSATLAWVDELLDAAPSEPTAPASLAATVRLLVDGAPVPDPGFAQRLEAQLRALGSSRSFATAPAII